MKMPETILPTRLYRGWTRFSRRIGLEKKQPDPVRIGAFISIPKNASKAVLDILQLGPNRGKETTNSVVIYENHQRGEILRVRHNLNDLFVFCFVRNPYDRCISWYEYHRQRDYAPYSSMSFDRWIREGLPHHWERIGQTNWKELGLSPLLQYNFVTNCRMDFIGRMENFQKDLTIIVDRLNEICVDKHISRRFHFTPHTRNVSKRKKGIKEYYSDDTKELVYRYLQQDFEYFGYER